MEEFAHMATGRLAVYACIVACAVAYVVSRKGRWNAYDPVAVFAAGGIGLIIMAGVVLMVGAEVPSVMVHLVHKTTHAHIHLHSLDENAKLEMTDLHAAHTVLSGLLTIACGIGGLVALCHHDRRHPSEV